MRQSNIAYPNLRAEMSRRNLGLVEMAKTMGRNRDSLARKLAKKTQISLQDAFEIQETFFPELDVLYLFSDEATAS